MSEKQPTIKLYINNKELNHLNVDRIISKIAHWLRRGGYPDVRIETVRSALITSPENRDIIGIMAHGQLEENYIEIRVFREMT